MTFTILAVSDALLGTIASSLLAALVGFFAWSTNSKNSKIQQMMTMRQVDSEEKQNILDEKAELVKAQIEANKAQIEAFQTVISTLTDQYEAATKESILLRKRLSDGNARFDILDEQLRIKHREYAEEIAMLRGRISAMVLELAEGSARILILRTEVTRLGGDVDEINRVGKRGQPGEKGETGDKGEPGDVA